MVSRVCGAMMRGGLARGYGCVSSVLPGFEILVVLFFSGCFVGAFAE